MYRILLSLFILLTACASVKADIIVSNYAYSGGSLPSAVTGVALEGTNEQLKVDWTEPASVDPITDYIVEYKEDTDVSYTDWPFDLGEDGESTIITGLANGQDYDVRIAAVNATGTGPYSTPVRGAPSAAAPLTDVITSGLEAWWDARNGYTSGSQVWGNKIVSPSSGASQSAYNLLLGASNSASTDDPSHGGSYWNFDGGDFFTSQAVANTTFLKNMHKTTGGTSWTIYTKIKPSSVLTVNSMFATADNVGEFGTAMRADSGGNVKFDQFNGVGLVTKQATAKITSPSMLYNLAIAYDSATNKIYFAVNSNTFQEISPSGWTSSISTDASGIFRVGAETSGGGKMTAGTRMYTMILMNKKISDAELLALNEWSDIYYSPPEPTVPAQVKGLVAMPSDTKVNLAYTIYDDGGTPITDYLVEYKTTASPTWLTFSDGVNDNQFTSVTGLTNNTSYDFRVSAINVVGTGATSVTFTATPKVPGTEPYDMDLFKVTYPVNSAGLRSGSAIEISPPAINTETSAWFSRVNGENWFIAPDGGATTATATYCRSEARHLTNFAYNVSTSDTLKFSVDAIPDGQKVIVHQIHGLDNPWVKHTYTGSNTCNGLLRALVKPTYGGADVTVILMGAGAVNPALQSGICNGTQIKSKIDYVYLGSNTGRLDFYINDLLAGTSALNRSAVDGDGGAGYFKRGAYNQDARKLGTYVLVRHYLQTGTYLQASNDNLPEYLKSKTRYASNENDFQAHELARQLNAHNANVMRN